MIFESLSPLHKHLMLKKKGKINKRIKVALILRQC